MVEFSSAAQPGNAIELVPESLWAHYLFVGTHLSATRRRLIGARRYVRGKHQIKAHMPSPSTTTCSPEFQGDFTAQRVGRLVAFRVKVGAGRRGSSRAIRCRKW